MAIRFVEREPEWAGPEREPSEAEAAPSGTEPGDTLQSGLEPASKAEDAGAPPLHEGKPDGVPTEKAGPGGDLLPGIDPPRRPPRRRRKGMMGFS